MEAEEAAMAAAPLHEAAAAAAAAARGSREPQSLHKTRELLTTGKGNNNSPLLLLLLLLPLWARICSQPSIQLFGRRQAAERAQHWEIQLAWARSRRLGVWRAQQVATCCARIWPPTRIWRGREVEEEQQRALPRSAKEPPKVRASPAKCSGCARLNCAITSPA